MLIAAVLATAACETTVGHPVARPLDPERSRAQIVAIDAVVFEDTPLTEDGRVTVADAFAGLASIAAADATNTVAVALGGELRTLSYAVSRMRPGTLMTNSDLPRQWMRIRGTLFNDAAWFRRSSRDPIEPVVATPAPASGLRPPTDDERRALNDTLDSLAGLIERTKADLTSASDSDEHRRLVTDVQRELELDVTRLGSRPGVYDIDVFYRDAHMAAEAAISSLQSFTNQGTDAPVTTREYFIKKAEEQLDKARDSAKNIPPAR
jgi:hypothetical protein